MAHQGSPISGNGVLSGRGRYSELNLLSKSAADGGEFKKYPYAGTKRSVCESAWLIRTHVLSCTCEDDFSTEASSY